MSKYTFVGAKDGVRQVKHEGLSITEVAYLVECMSCAEGSVADECSIRCISDSFLSDLLCDGEALISLRQAGVKLSAYSFREVHNPLAEVDCE